jgi:hypothetical protein
LQYFFILTRIVAILSLIPTDITGSQVKPLKFIRSPSSLGVGGDGMAFVNLIVEILAASWTREIQFIMCAIIVYWDGWVSAAVRGRP